MNSEEDYDHAANLKYNKELSELPAPSLEQREAFINWLDYVHTICMHVFYATVSEERWQDLCQEREVSFVLVGQPDKRNTEIPRGLYCVDLHPLIRSSYRDPVALAFAHLTKAPDDLVFVPSALSVVLPKPTAHEIFSAKMFFRKLINDNTENQDLCDWASKLK